MPKNDQGIFLKITRFINFLQIKVIKKRYKRSKLLKPFVPNLTKKKLFLCL